MDFAVIAAGGKQYVVSVGQKIRLDYVASPLGSAVSFPTLLYVHGDGKIDVGQPLLHGTVSGKVTDVGRSLKVMVLKFKRKVRYRRKVGHRTPTSTVEVTALP